MIEIRTVAVATVKGDSFDNEAQTDYRGACPNSVIVVLGDGRLITINGEHIVVHGPDMETLLDVPLPASGDTPQASDYTEAEARAAYGDR